MKKKLQNITRDRAQKTLRQALSPTFLFILMGAALLWYTTKLGYEYSTEIPVNLRIDGQRYRLTAIVSGRGSTILAQQLSLKSALSFTLDEFSSRPSRETPGALTITPASLQRVINGKITDLVIVQVVDAPEFVPAPPEEVEEADSEGDGGKGAAASKNGGESKGRAK
ncbi:MAG: hypothetical protein LBV38_04795 [Alistipes sp.]|jgi:hypothetical protein|nr:hypothetical protein [Alistipes sp.]